MIWSFRFCYCFGRAPGPVACDNGKHLSEDAQEPAPWYGDARLRTGQVWGAESGEGGAERYRVSNAVSPGFSVTVMKAVWFLWTPMSDTCWSPIRRRPGCGARRPES
jgi:hypothetical protein